jgi:hypothetical protein
MVPKNKISDSFWIKKKLEAKCDYDGLCKFFCEPKKKEIKSITDDKSKKTDTVQSIKILDDKRLMNLGIVLSKVNFSNDELKQIIENFSYDVINLDMLEKVISMAPNSEEIDKLKTYTGDTSLISHGENFCLMLMSIKFFMNKLTFIKLRKTIQIEKTEIIGRLETLKDACISIKESQAFMNILKLILLMGNYLNADSPQGNASGFLLGTLALLESVKSNGKEKYTLLDFLVLNVKSKDNGLITFYKDFEDLDKALQIDLADTELKAKEFDNNLKKLQKEKEIAAKEKDEIGYLNFLTELEKESNQSFTEITKLQTDLNVQMEETAKYFGEDMKNFKIIDFIKVIQNFITNFKKIALKFSAEEAKQIKKKINEEKNKKPELKIKYVKDLEKIMQNVERKTLARKTAMKNISKEEKNKLEEMTPRVISKTPNNYKPIIKDSNKSDKKNINKTRMTRTRITKFIKDNINSSDEDLANIESDYLMINQPLKIQKLSNLNAAHKSNYY